MWCGVSPGGDIESAMATGTAAVAQSSVSQPTASIAAVGITAPLAGNVFKVIVSIGDQVQSGDVVLILEAMKMETEIRASSGGVVNQVLVREGDTVEAGEALMTLG